MTTRPDLAAYLLAALVVICATVLLGLERTVPDALWLLAFTAVGGGAGASVTARTAEPSADGRRRNRAAP